MAQQTEFKPLPDWSDAPDWANWRAVDSDGELFYYEEEPIPLLSMWGCVDEVYFAGSGYDPSNWRNSLEKRPADGE